MKLKHIYLAPLLLFLIVSCREKATNFPVSPLWNDLQSGPYHVGLKIDYVFDTSRFLAIDDTQRIIRPLRLMIWYPGVVACSDTVLRFSDYIHTAPADKRFAAYNNVLNERDLNTAQRQFSHPAGDSLVNELMNTATAVYRDLPPAPGTFPLILHSLGRNNFQQESTVLWEYLASHGYVVAVIPQFGSSLEDNRLSFSREDLEIQLQDVKYTLGKLKRYVYVDASRVAVMGHSSGALIALLAASRNRQIDAIISLDGSISTTDGVTLLTEFDWTKEQLRIPILNLYAAGKKKLDLSLLDQLSACDRYHVAFYKAIHFDFQNWPVYAVLTNFADPRMKSFRPLGTGRDIYISAVRLSTHFLNSEFRSDEQAQEYLKAPVPESHIPADLVNIRFQKKEQ